MDFGIFLFLDFFNSLDFLDFLDLCGKIFSSFLATREELALLANDPIMSGTSIRSFRHLEHQNSSSNG